MNQYDGIDTLLDFLAKRYPAGSPEAQIQAGVWRWIEGDAPALHRCLDLPASPAVVRRAQRDKYLRMAAAHFEGGPWERAGQLAETVRDFDLRKWPIWYRLDTAPPHATELQKILYAAFKAGASFPKSQDMYHLILLPE